MKRTIIVSLFLIIACREEKKEVKNIAEPQQIKEKIVLNNESDEVENAKKWLEKSIEDYFKTDLGSAEKSMEKITTKDYFDYKSDAMNVDMEVDGSLTEKEFQEKWRKKFDVQKAGIGVGFLISGQDWDEIKVSSCKVLTAGENDFLFDVILSDKKLKAEYPIKVNVIKDNGSFLIADVQQEVPVFN
ncbi:hypothetical protein DRF59_18800 [Chryseobacterium flavum]|uniref:DUF3828 domain-containing protein n=1 Tax=Chryseobacterium flavum TaxID=415851 RepID=A0A3D9CGH5_9FLAO|nr:hypothetical protein [Chryseobacterium flavum]REC64835.1 hypothetical protein DRF59_18800 [Chryseobacterium flavum]